MILEKNTLFKMYSTDLFNYFINTVLNHERQLKSKIIESSELVLKILPNQYFKSYFNQFC